MDSSNTSAVSMYSTKTVTIHTILIVSVCAAFGIINIVSKAVAVGAVTLGMGIVVLLVITMIRKRTQIATQGFFSVYRSAAYDNRDLGREARAAHHVRADADFYGGIGAVLQR